jgi:hypothetical protein
MGDHIGVEGEIQKTIPVRMVGDHQNFVPQSRYPMENPFDEGAPQEWHQGFVLPHPGRLSARLYDNTEHALIIIEISMLCEMI